MLLFKQATETKIVILILSTWILWILYTFDVI